MTAVIIFIVTVIVVPVLVGECVDWLPWVGTRLIRQAARRLPIQYRARYEEEWRAEFKVLPGGKLTKLGFGLRLYAGARRTGAVLQVEINMAKAEHDMDTAARVLSLAQQTADVTIADARKEADELLGEAMFQAQRILTAARGEAEKTLAMVKSQAVPPRP